MATASSITSSLSSTECLICLEPMTQPRMLPCEHRFCQSCTSSYIRGVKDDDDVTCPVCRRKTTSPQPGLSRDQWAQTFPVPFIHQKQERLCDPCVENDENNEATNYCIDCREALCSTCARSHKTMKISRSHKVTTLDEAQLTMSIAPETILFCPDHRGKTVDVYCLDHSLPCCSLCLTEKHRQCKSVDSIDNLSKDIRQSKQPDKLLSQLDTFYSHTRDIIKHYQNNADKLEGDGKQIVNKIKSIRTDINALLQHLEDAAINTLGSKIKSEITKINEHIDECEILRDNIKRTMDNLSAVAARGSDSSLFLANREAGVKYTEYEHGVKVKHEQAFDVGITFTTKKVLDTLRASVREIGKLSVSRTRAGLPPLSVGETAPSEAAQGYSIAGQASSTQAVAPPAVKDADTMTVGGRYHWSGWTFMLDTEYDVYLYNDHAILHLIGNQCYVDYVMDNATTRLDWDGNKEKVPADILDRMRAIYRPDITPTTPSQPIMSRPGDKTLNVGLLKFTSPKAGELSVKYLWLSYKITLIDGHSGFDLWRNHTQKTTTYTPRQPLDIPV